MFIGRETNKSSQEKRLIEAVLFIMIIGQSEFYIIFAPKSMEYLQKYFSLTVV